MALTIPVHYNDYCDFSADYYEIQNSLRYIGAWIIRNVRCNKFYVGATGNPSERLRRHEYEYKETHERNNKYHLAKFSSADTTAEIEEQLVEIFAYTGQCENQPFVDEDGDIDQASELGFNENTRYIYIRQL